MKFLSALFSVALCLVPFAARAQKCGVPAIKPDISSNILGGKDAVAYSWPWQVTVHIWMFDRYNQMCGGSLIANQWILTSAGCFYDFIPWSPRIQIRLGVFDSNRTDEAGQQNVNVTEYHIHPQYSRPNATNNAYNDVALLKLKDPVQYTDHISPICLPTQQDEALPAAGTSIFVAGWGWKNPSNPGTGKETLKQVSGPTVATDACKQAHVGRIDEKNHFCAGTKSSGPKPWIGDEGGPGVVQDPPGSGTWKQIGISLAWESDNYWVLSRVSAFVDFIKQYVIL
jgi:secreted trypsin-like serine protease